MVSLSKRLNAVASLVESGSSVADVGTDHGYIPVYLVENKISPFVVAMDINEKPLASCKSLVKNEGFEDVILTRLSNGLEKLNRGECDTVIIAGMGAELIVDILSNCDFVNELHLILQPMTSAPELRTYLSEHGFAVKQEQAVQDGDHIYTVMQAEYDPEHVQTSQVFPYIGILKADSDENKAYIHQQCSRLQKRINGLRQSGRQEELANETEQILRQLQQVLSQAE